MGLVALTAKEGFWRSNRTSTVFTDCSLFFMTDAKKQAKKRCCPLVVGTNASICKGLNFTDPDSQCLAALDADANSTNEAYGGPACLACKNASYTMQDEANKRCSPCPGGSSLGGVIGALSGLMGVLWIGFAVLFYKANRNHDDGKAVEKKKKKKGCCGGKTKKEDNKQRKLKPKKTLEQKVEDSGAQNAASRLVGDQMMLGRVQGSGGESGSDAATASASDTVRGDEQVIVDRVKVIYGWLQVSHRFIHNLSQK
jgi:hypothetical protein